MHWRFRGIPAFADPASRSAVQHSPKLRLNIILDNSRKCKETKAQMNGIMQLTQVKEYTSHDLPFICPLKRENSEITAEVCAMFNADLFISVGTWVTGVGMSAVGIEMTINPPSKETKWLYRSSSIVMGLYLSDLAFGSSLERTGKAKRLANEHQQERVAATEGNTKYMQGQLDTINKVLSSLSFNSNPHKRLEF